MLSTLNIHFTLTIEISYCVIHHSICDLYGNMCRLSSQFWRQQSNISCRLCVRSPTVKAHMSALQQGSGTLPSRTSSMLGFKMHDGSGLTISPLLKFPNNHQDALMGHSGFPPTSCFHDTWKHSVRNLLTILLLTLGYVGSGPWYSTQTFVD